MGEKNQVFEFKILWPMLPGSMEKILIALYLECVAVSLCCLITWLVTLTRDL